MPLAEDPAGALHKQETSLQTSAPHMEVTGTTKLGDMPDEQLLEIMSKVPPQSLAQLRRTGGDLARLAGEESLWAMHCKAIGLSSRNDAPRLSSQARFARYADSLCHECRKPTPYQFVLLRRRLCEDCERELPRKYLLSTAKQLVHTRSAVQDLNATQQAMLWPMLKSVELKGFRWYLRSQAIACAEAVLEADAAAVEEAAGAEEKDEAAAALEDEPMVGPAAAEGAAVTSATTRAEDEADEVEEEAAAEREERGEELHPGAVTRAWEEAAEAHRRQQTPKAAAKAAARAAQKEHKKKAKLEARERRQGVRTEAHPKQPRSPAEVAKKRASASHHRAHAEGSAWQIEYDKLQELFGDGLAGLSGLVLARERE